MRYVVLGAGAIGGGVGGLLHLAGLDATLIARGDHLKALQSDGLDLTVGHDRHTLRVPAVADAGEVDWTDDTVLLLGVKSQQTEAAVASLLGSMPVTTPVVSLQNGVANERRLLRHVANVHGICVMMPASHLSPGRVVVQSAGLPGLLDVGRYPGGVDETTEEVAADLTSAGFESIARPDVMRWKYRKLLMNLGNGVDAACRDDDAATELVARARREGEQALAAAGIDAISREVDLERRGERLRPLVDRDGAGSSTWQSVRRATGDVEVDYLNGEIVLLGRLHGVPTPANELIRHVVNDLVRTRGEVGSLEAADLLARLD